MRSLPYSKSMCLHFSYLILFFIPLLFKRCHYVLKVRWYISHCPPNANFLTFKGRGLINNKANKFSTPWKLNYYSKWMWKIKKLKIRFWNQVPANLYRVTHWGYKYGEDYLWWHWNDKWKIYDEAKDDGAMMSAWKIVMWWVKWVSKIWFIEK